MKYCIKLVLHFYFTAMEVRDFNSTNSLTFFFQTFIDPSNLHHRHHTDITHTSHTHPSIMNQIQKWVVLYKALNLQRYIQKNNNGLIASDFESAQLQLEQWGTKRFSNKFNQSKQGKRKLRDERQEIDNLTTD